MSTAQVILDIISFCNKQERCTTCPISDENGCCPFRGAPKYWYKKQVAESYTIIKKNNNDKKTSYFGL